MNSKIYKQYDEKWRSLPYPTSNSSFGGNGCGACSVLHCIIEREKYKNWTPKDINPYMKGWAEAGHGTLWKGIYEALKHYGMENVKWFGEADPMSDVFAELNKGGRIGVILFGDTVGPDGTVWTVGGHYIAFLSYRVRNGKHEFFLKDSGGRDHDGWFVYEKSMMGDVRQVWTCTLPKDEPSPEPTPEPTPTPDPSPRTDTYTGEYPVVKKYLEPGDRGIQVTRLQNYVNWYFKGKFFEECGPADGVYGKNTLRWVNKMLTEFFGASEADGLVGPKTIAEMKRRGGAKTNERVIDISEFQSTIDFNKVKKAGISGVIVRCGRRGGGTTLLSEDPMFMEHITRAHKAGLKVGIYMFTEAVNAAEGKEEAQYAIKMMKKAGIPLSYPIGIDSEDVFWKENGRQYKGRANSGVLSKEKRTEAIKGFCEEIKRQGYDSMIYASLAWFSNQLNMAKLPYNVWCAQWGSSCDYKGKYVMWQYSSDGSVSGIKGRVDMNYWYGK